MQSTCLHSEFQGSGVEFGEGSEGSFMVSPQGGIT